MPFPNILSVMTLEIAIFSKNISQLVFENFFYSLVYAYRDTYHNFSCWDMSMNLRVKSGSANAFITLSDRNGRQL